MTKNHDYGRLFSLDKRGLKIVSGFLSKIMKSRKIYDIDKLDANSSIFHARSSFC